MTAPTSTTCPRHQTPYEYRLSLVVGVLQDRTDLDISAAGAAAASVLHAIDTIPEHVR